MRCANNRADDMTNLIALQNGTELVGDYRIERVLGAGGFGITYLAEEIALGRSVTIKEYFPSDFAARSNAGDASPRSEGCSSDYRWGLDRFIEEAQTLAKFNHPNIVRVYRYFRANNTGYMVLHFEEGQSLKSWLKGLKRAPRQIELDKILSPLLDALETIHKEDFLHRDIAPDNIIIRKDGQPVLIDFGSARGEIASASKTVSALVKPGYSPYEQYAETSRQQGPWTDIYALGSTLYHAISGKRPPDAPSRMVQDEYVVAGEVALSAYRPRFLKAIDKSLALPIEDRPQSIAAWRGELIAPEEAKPSWLHRQMERSRGKAAVKDQAATAKTVPLPGGQPPPPDAPGPQGGMLDFLEGLKKKHESGGEVQFEAAAAPAVAAKKPAAKAPAATVQLKEPAAAPKLPALLPRRSAKPPAPPRKRKPKAKPKAKAKARPKARKIAGHSRSWRPLLFKLLVGVGVASGAVAMQDKLPRMESRGTATTSSQQGVEPVLAGKFEGHKGGVTALAYSDDGRVLVTTGKDGTLKVWNASSSSLLRTIELDDGPAISLALMSTRAVTGHADGTVAVWDFERVEKVAQFKRNAAEIWSVTFAGNPNRVAVSSHDWKVTLWDVDSPSQPKHVIDAHDNAAQAIAFIASPKGPMLASGGADKTVKLWNLKSLDRVRRYRGHRDFVTALAFSPNGLLLASAGLDGNIRLWSTNSRRTYRRLRGHSGKIASLAFSPSGKRLVSAGDDGQVRIWDIRRGRTARTLTGTTGSVTAVRYSPDGQHIASAGEDGIVRLWNPQAALR